MFSEGLADKVVGSDFQLDVDVDLLVRGEYRFESFSLEAGLDGIAGNRGTFGDEYLHSMAIRRRLEQCYRPEREG